MANGPKISELKAGDVLIADEGFTCLKAGEHVVKRDHDGLYVECSEGHHYLVGQEGDDERLIGLTLKAKAEA